MGASLGFLTAWLPPDSQISCIVALQKCSREAGRSCIGLYDLVGSHTVSLASSLLTNQSLKLDQVQGEGCRPQLLMGKGSKNFQMCLKTTTPPSQMELHRGGIMLCSLLYLWHLKQSLEHRECPIIFCRMSKIVKNVLKFNPPKYFYPNSCPQS